jgi:hypothetical protein
MPILIDEWQRFPESFDRVRRAVDAVAAPNSFTESPPVAAASTTQPIASVTFIAVRAA